MTMVVPSTLSNHRSRNGLIVTKTGILLLCFFISSHLSTSLYDRKVRLIVSSFHVPVRLQQRQQQHYSPLLKNPFTKSISPLFFNVMIKNSLKFVDNRDNYKQQYRYEHKHQWQVSSRANPAALMMTTTRTDGSTYYKDDVERDLPDPNFIRVVETLLNQKAGRVVAEDVTTATGVSIEMAKRGLIVLVIGTGGNITVDNVDKKIVFSFPNTRIRSILALNFRKNKLSNLVMTGLSVLSWFLRVTFGMMLIVTSPVWLGMVLFFEFLRFLTPYDRKNNNDDDFYIWGDGYDLSSFWDPSSLELFFYRPFNYSSRYCTTDTDPKKMKFLEAMFSIVFGDGNPNPLLEERRLQLVSQVIRQNHGVVTAEQLAPFCDNIPSVDVINTEANSRSVIDESYVLPIVTALNGDPQIASTGDIIYVFRDFQESNSTTGSVSETKSDIILVTQVKLSETASNQEKLQLLENNDMKMYSTDRNSLIITGSTLENPDFAKTSGDEKKEGDSILSENLWEVTFAPSKYWHLAFLSWCMVLYVEVNLIIFVEKLQVLYTMYGQAIPIILTIVSEKCSFLLGYTLSLLLIYQIQNMWIKDQNPKIQERNNRRIAWKRFLDDSVQVGKPPSNPIHSKLQAADEQYRQKCQKTVNSII